HFRRLLEGMTADPKQRLAELPLLDDGERHQLLVAWPDTRTPYPEASLQELFEARVEATPEAVAGIFGTGGDREEQLSYRELNRRANRLAHHLRTLGVGPDVLAGICLERSWADFGRIRRNSVTPNTRQVPQRCGLPSRLSDSAKRCRHGGR
ncbi:MAG: AMP-binding protein, partial [bacterium]|nr:AMP-binding protein [bacterium]